MVFNFILLLCVMLQLVNHLSIVFVLMLLIKFIYVNFFLVQNFLKIIFVRLIMKKSDDTLNDIGTLISDSWNLLNEKLDFSGLHQDLLCYQVDGDCLAVSFTALAFDTLVKSINSRAEFIEKIKPFLFHLDKEADKDIFFF